MPVMIRRTAFDFPLALFLTSAALGVWTAYDKQAAWTKFWLIVVGIALYYLVAWLPERVGAGRVEPLRIIFALLPLGVGIYFLLTNSWVGPDNETAWVSGLFPRVTDALPALPAYRLHANTLGGIMAVFIPLQAMAFFKDVRASRSHWRTAAGLLAVTFSFVMLVISRSYGAGSALGLVAAGWLLEKLYARVNKRWALLMTLATLALIFMIGFAIFGPRVVGVRTDRIEVWRNSFDLATDYVFTGLGLDNFVMPYSSYVLLVHVEHTYHAHNLFLNVWIGQGLPGLVAVATLFIAAFTRRDAANQWRVAASAAIAVLLLHGLVDDAFYGYFGGKAVMLMFLPFGVLARPHADFVAQPWRVWTTNVVASASLLLTLAVVALWPTGRAALWRNLGAVLQNQAELTVYQRQRDGNIQDSIRVKPEVNIESSARYFRTALALNPTDAGANRRLGQIELTLGQYDAAQGHLQKAYLADPQQRATRQLLGESYAATGNVAEAVRLWRTVDLSQNQLEMRVNWYRVFTKQEERAQWIEQAITALERP